MIVGDDLDVLRRQVRAIVVGLALAPRDVYDGQMRLVEDLGYDSLRLVELSIAIRAQFGVDLDPETSAGAQTLDAVIELVAELAVRGAG